MSPPERRLHGVGLGDPNGGLKNCGCGNIFDGRTGSHCSMACMERAPMSSDYQLDEDYREVFTGPQSSAKGPIIGGPTVYECDCGTWVHAASKCPTCGRAT